MLCKDAKRISDTIEQLHKMFRCELWSLLSNPATMPCGHEYCRNCIVQYMLRNRQNTACPVCQFQLQERDVKRRTHSSRHKVVKAIRRLFMTIRERFDIEVDVLAKYEGEIFYAFKSRYCSRKQQGEIAQQRTKKLIEDLEWYTNKPERKRSSLEIKSG